MGLRDPANPLGLTFGQRLEDELGRFKQQHPEQRIRHTPFSARLLADVEREEEQVDPDD